MSVSEKDTHTKKLCPSLCEALWQFLGQRESSRKVLETSVRSIDVRPKVPSGTKTERLYLLRI